MKKFKGLALGAAMLGLLVTGVVAGTDSADAAVWTARTVEEVRADIAGKDEYTVKERDTLSVIAEAWGKNEDDLAKLNNIADKDVIKVGQKLVAGNGTLKAIDTNGNVIAETPDSTYVAPVASQTGNYVSAGNGWTASNQGGNTVQDTNTNWNAGGQGSTAVETPADNVNTGGTNTGTPTNPTNPTNPTDPTPTPNPEPTPTPEPDPTIKWGSVGNCVTEYPNDPTIQQNGGLWTSDDDAYDWGLGKSEAEGSNHNGFNTAEVGMSDDSSRWTVNFY